MAERHTYTNEVEKTWHPEPRREHVSRLEREGRRADRPFAADLVHVPRQDDAGLRGRHDRIRALRLRAAGLLAELQVPPATRPRLLLRSLRQLPDDGRRDSERARLHDAVARGRRREGPELHRLAPARPHAGDRQVRRPVHAARLLLQDVHSSPQALAALREVPSRRRRTRAARSERLAPGARRCREPAHRRRRDRRWPGRPRGRDRRSAGGQLGRRDRRGLRRRRRAPRRPRRDRDCRRASARCRRGRGRDPRARDRDRALRAGHGARRLRQPADQVPRAPRDRRERDRRAATRLPGQRPHRRDAARTPCVGSSTASRSSRPSAPSC